MQITRNSTGMLTALTVTADKDARDYAVVVVKGTFEAAPNGVLRLADEQAPFVYADQHHGDPATTGIRYESDFALFKPFTDVVVVGMAVAPGGLATPEMAVRLEVQGQQKDAVVIGDRRWVDTFGGLTASPPLPFTQMPLVFDRAFGGVDDSRGPGAAAIEARNFVGVGFHPHRSRKELHGAPLPNIEDPRQRLHSHRDRVAPIGFGFVGRAWTPRSSFVGTYDQRWLDHVCPFLPEDFDHRYHQGAPADQQFPHFGGGEIIRCFYMAERPIVQYTIPTLEMPVVFCFRDRSVAQAAVLDTIVLEPHRYRASLSWRARVALGKNVDDLKEVHLGVLPNDNADDGFLGYRRGKPVFRGIASTIRWLDRRRGRR